MNEDQRQYELMFILSPELEEKDIALFQEEIRHSVEGLSGRITKQEKPEKRNLSYLIKKCSSAYYLIINFLIAPDKLNDLSASLKHNKNILRYILAFKEELAAPKIKKETLRKPERQLEAEATEAPPLKEKKEHKTTKLEDIDKKLEEILGI